MCAFWQVFLLFQLGKPVQQFLLTACSILFFLIILTQRTQYSPVQLLRAVCLTIFYLKVINVTQPYSSYTCNRFYTFFLKNPKHKSLYPILLQFFAGCIFHSILPQNTKFKLLNLQNGSQQPVMVRQPKCTNGKLCFLSIKMSNKPILTIHQYSLWVVQPNH